MCDPSQDHHHHHHYAQDPPHKEADPASLSPPNLPTSHFLHDLLRLVLMLALLLAASLAALSYLTSLLPAWSHSGLPPLKLYVGSVRDVQVLAQTLQHYSQHAFHRVLALYTLVYVLKQTFCIPGTAALNIVGGTLYGAWAAPPLALACTLVGIAACYTLSRTLLPPFAARLPPLPHLPAGGGWWPLVVLRVFPLTPQWLVNLVAPHAGVRLAPLLAASALGLLPYTLMTTHLGVLFLRVHTLDALLTPTHMLQLLALAALAALPILAKRLAKRGQVGGVVARRGVVGREDDKVA